jgi:exodeoxyribonuclease-5
MISLDVDQSKAFNILEDMYNKGGEKVIKGSAGCGKSELISQFANKYPETIVAAPTHKACDVLRRKGVPEPRTIHSLMYIMHEETEDVPLLDKNKNPVINLETKEPIIEKIVTGQKWIPRDEPIKEAVVFEEASMNGLRRLNDIRAVTSRRTLVGDGFQLPPVKDKDIFNEMQADVELTKVWRINDSPPLAFATALRLHGDCDPAHFDIPVLPRVRSSLEQIIETNGVTVVWRNVTRHEINRTIRMLKGYPQWVPEIGDKIIFYETDQELGVYNGLGAVVDKVFDADHLKAKIRVLCDSGEYRTFNAASDPLRGLPFTRIGQRHEDDPLHIEYAYAITCHKAQGSEWSNVYVIDDLQGLTSVTGEMNAKRWFYTAITRTSKNLTILQ